MAGSEVPILDTLRPGRGTLRLAVSRWLFIAAASLPALVAGLAGASRGAARRPYDTEVVGTLPMVQFSRLASEALSGFFPAALVSVLLALLLDQLLTAGALVVLGPERAPGERVRVLATTARDGLLHLWPFLRIVVFGLAFAALGIATIGWGFKKLILVGTRAGWSGATSTITLPLLALGLMLWWSAIVGAWVFWSRVITVADGRRRVRRTAPLVLHVFWRHPLRACGWFVAITSCSTLASGAVVVAWRQSDPASASAVFGWVAASLVALALQAYLWQGLLRFGRLLYATESLADLHGRPDEPWHVPSRLVRWAGARLRRGRGPDGGIATG